MKVARIAGLLITAIIFNNIQAMQIPKEYPLDKQLLLGEITVETYLELQVSHKVSQLATAEYLDPDNNYYENLIAVIKRTRSMYVGSIQRHGLTDKMLQRFHRFIKKRIDLAYEALEADIMAGEAKPGKRT